MSHMTKSTSPQAAWSSNNHWGFSQKRGKSICIFQLFNWQTWATIPDQVASASMWPHLPGDTNATVTRFGFWQLLTSSKQFRSMQRWRLFWLKTVYHPPHWRSCTWSSDSQLKTKSMRKTKYIENINSPQLDFPTYGVEQVDFIAPVVGVSGRSALGGFHLPAILFPEQFLLLATLSPFL